MSVEELLDELGIMKVGTYSKDNSYVIDLDDSEDFGKMYSMIDNNDELDYDEDVSYLNFDDSSLVYDYKDLYTITLMADMNADTYKIVVQKQ